MARQYANPRIEPIDELRDLGIRVETVAAREAREKRENDCATGLVPGRECKDVTEKDLKWGRKLTAERSN